MTEADRTAEFARILAENRRYTDAFDRSALTAAPLSRLVIVACMDARLDVEESLGLRTGDAHIIRNAGGLVTDDVIRSLIISMELLGTEEIVLIEHTRCGLHDIDEDALDESLSVVWELEPGARILEKAGFPRIDRADSSEQLEAFLDAVRWGAATSADRLLLQAPFRSGVEIQEYSYGNLRNHVPKRTRKLLLHRHQIHKLDQHSKRGGFTLVPLRIYFKGPYAKVALALARGREQHDKRQAKAEREAKKEIARATRRRER